MYSSLSILEVSIVTRLYSYTLLVRNEIDANEHGGLFNCTLIFVHALILMIILLSGLLVHLF